MERNLGKWCRRSWVWGTARLGVSIAVWVWGQEERAEGTREQAEKVAGPRQEELEHDLLWPAVIGSWIQERCSAQGGGDQVSK